MQHVYAERYSRLIAAHLRELTQSRSELCGTLWHPFHTTRLSRQLSASENWLDWSDDPTGLDVAFQRRVVYLALIEGEMTNEEDRPHVDDGNEEQGRLYLGWRESRREESLFR